MNLTPEQKAREKIDAMLLDAGWSVQDKAKLDFGASRGIAVREYPTDVGPADYVLFVDRKPVGVIEAKKEKKGQNITSTEKQSAEYARAKLKWIQDRRPLRFVYESTGGLTRFRAERQSEDSAPKRTNLKRRAAS